MTTPWPPKELDLIARAAEVQLSTTRADGTLRPFVPVWIVRIGNALYVRSYRGQAGAWYRHARHDPHGHLLGDGIDRSVDFATPDDVAIGIVDDAYRAKYGRRGGGSYVQAMTRPYVAATTLRLSPR
jgi:hypothetical protein